MFNRLFALSIVVMLILFAGIGYYLYQEHTEEIIPSWNDLEINETPNVARLNGQFDKKLLSVEVPMEPPPIDRWEYKPQIQQPAATEEFVEIPIDQIEFREITTPDGKIHLAPFPKGSPPIKGGYVSYPEENEKLITPNSYFVFENVQVPEGENLEDYQMKTLLAAAHGISMEEVEAQLKQGTLTYTIEPSNENWADGIEGAAELIDFLTDAGVSDDAIDATFDSPDLSEKSTSSAAEVTEKSQAEVPVAPSGIPEAVKSIAPEAINSKPTPVKKESEPNKSEVEGREIPMEEQRSPERPRRLRTPPAPSVPEAPQEPNIEQ